MLTIFDDEGDVIHLRGRMVVCGRCGGRGKHVNEAIDGNGISTDDECWDDEQFCEMYLGGGYDVTCTECGGRNVVEVPDERSWTPEQVERYWAARREEAEDRHTRWAEDGYPR